eukprot:jgi/Mesvir1/23925/Mv10701-RA.1
MPAITAHAFSSGVAVLQQSVRTWFNPAVPWRKACNRKALPRRTVLAEVSGSTSAGDPCRGTNQGARVAKRICGRCKLEYDPTTAAGGCRYHPAEYGGETSGKLINVINAAKAYTSDVRTGVNGQLSLYWQCCGEEDMSHPGCTVGQHVPF